MKKKRPTILLEVLVAFTLTAVATSLIAAVPHTFFKRSMKEIKAIEAERIANLTFGEIAKTFHLNHKWESIPPATEKERLELAPYPVSLSLTTSCCFQRYYKIGWLKERSSDTKRLISLQIFIDKTPYNYIFVQEKKT
ncbi:MAG: hypothetical protein MRY21_00445 [Simkaniaceae bacterium]|nr:hypothetical protein [Simkaniaceae bacterium]